MKGEISLPSSFLKLSPSLLLSHPPPFVPPPKPKALPPPASFEEAIALTGQGTKCKWLVVVASGFCILCGIVETVGISYLLPAARCDLRLTPSDKTLLGGVTTIGMMLSLWPWGLLADSWGRRPVLLTCLSLDTIFGILSSMAPSLTFLLVCRFFNGLSVSGPSAVSYAFLSEYHGEAARPRALVVSGLFVASAVIGMPATAWIILTQEINFILPWGINLSSWRIYLMMMALPSLISALLISSLDESPRFQMSKGREEEALKTLASMFSDNTGIPKAEYPVKCLQLGISNHQQPRSKKGGPLSALHNLWIKISPLFRPPHILPLALCCSLQAGAFLCANGLLMWLPDIFGRIAASDINSGPLCDALSLASLSTVILPMDGDVCQATVDTSAFSNVLVIGGTVGLAYTLTSLLSGYLNKRIFFGVLMLVGSAIGFGVAPSSPPSLTLALTSVFHACAGVSITLLGGLISDIFPTQLRAAALSISLTFGRFGMVGGSTVIGTLLEINCESAFHLVAAVALTDALLSLLLPKKQNTSSAA
ncbi:synaptic vesicle glycoprotein 2A-like [Ischnura elegans]|uniref:synaptic vesicle glycoprotein 2A-like n=1 Tax=Ischnura elegans TaxID=197161 RepID=UPI001ED8ACA3|nr:synaptic vesicle glycoprotein 2A-like [Ischnura elegans]